LGKTIFKAITVPTKLGAKGVVKVTPQPVKDVFSRVNRSVFTSVETRLRTLGPLGNEVAERFVASDDRAIGRTGQALSRMEDAGLLNLDKKKNAALLDALEGRVQPKALSAEVRKVYETVNSLRKEIGEEAAKKKIKVQLSTGKKVPFVSRKNFFPHIIPALNKLQKGNMRQEVIENSVRIGRFNTVDDAVKALDGFLHFVKTERRVGPSEFWLNYLVRTGQAKNKTEAAGITLRFFRQSKTARNSHLERSREIDFPFYDPDVRKIFPVYYTGAVQRLEQVGEFGPNGEILNKLSGAFARRRGKEVGSEQAIEDIAEFKKLIPALFGIIEASPKRQKISLFLRALSIPKLAFAQILNMGQSLNTLLATDLPSLSKGLVAGFTRRGQKTALESGATIQSILRQSATLGDDVPFADSFLKWTGFTWTEKFNRTVAANAGITYAQRLRRVLIENPENKTARRVLEELGLDVNSVIKKDFNREELLMVARKTSFLTQFRSAPKDLPRFAGTPEGKILFQYKNFIFNQTVFIKKQLTKEFQNQEYGKFSRDLLILATVFPMTGEVIADIRSLITGSTRPTNFLTRYLENLMNTGALGIWGDMITSARWGDFAGFVAGPTADAVFETMERMTKRAGYPRRGRGQHGARHVSIGGDSQSRCIAC